MAYICWLFSTKPNCKNSSVGFFYSSIEQRGAMTDRWGKIAWVMRKSMENSEPINQSEIKRSSKNSNQKAVETFSWKFSWVLNSNKLFECRKNHHEASKRDSFPPTIKLRKPISSSSSLVTQNIFFAVYFCFKFFFLPPIDFFAMAKNSYLTRKL